MARVSRIAIIALGCAGMLAPPVEAARRNERFEMFGVVCEARGTTYLTSFTTAVDRDPDPNVAAVYTLTPPQCRGRVRVTGFSWSKVDPSDIDVSTRGKRVTVPARIVGTIKGTTFRVTDLRTSELGSVRFDGFSLERPAIISSAFVGRNWPSSCDAGDSPVLSEKLPDTNQDLLIAALRDDPDLRVRNLLGGSREVVTYREGTASAKTLADVFSASLCVEQESSLPTVKAVQAYVRTKAIVAEVRDATLPSGRAMVLVSGEQITPDQKAGLLQSFGSRIVVDSFVRT